MQAVVPSTDCCAQEDGTVLQKNEGGWQFTLREMAKEVTLDVAVGKYLDTSLIETDVHPTWLSLRIKGEQEALRARTPSPAMLQARCFG